MSQPEETPEKQQAIREALGAPLMMWDEFLLPVEDLIPNVSGELTYHHHANEWVGSYILPPEGGWDT